MKPIRQSPSHQHRLSTLAVSKAVQIAGFDYADFQSRASFFYFLPDNLPQIGQIQLASVVISYHAQ
jgi:hypothetical protein